MKVLRVLGLVVITAVTLVVVVLGVAFVAVGNQMSETINVTVSPVPVPEDPESLARGRHLAQAITACTGCHGENLAGRTMADSPVFARFLAPNLTRGPGSAVEGYTVQDWVRAIRHGLDRQSRPLILMPARAYQHLSNEDLGALIAYLQGVPPVDNALEASTLNPIGRVVQLMSAPFLDARHVDHQREPMATTPPAGVTVEYGTYLSRMCSGCHGENMEGGHGPNLLRTQTLVPYDLSQFKLTMRTGITPADKQMDTDHMPWQNFGRMTDGELEALWVYLESVSR